MKVEFSKKFIKQLNALPKKETAADIVDKVIASFGHPHLHQGLGLRDLKVRGGSAYEARIGLGLRAVFRAKEDGLVFYFIGNHDDVQAWKKNNA